MIKEKKYSFFAHFNRINMQRNLANVWTVHYRGNCFQAKEIIFRVPIKTQYKPAGRQPRATLRGHASRVYNDGNSLVVS